MGLESFFKFPHLKALHLNITQRFGLLIDSELFKIKLCSHDPSPPQLEYVKGGGGIFADMAVHDLDMSRFLAGEDPIDILAVDACHIDKSISELEGSEKFDTASYIVRYPNGVHAMVDVCP